MPAKWSDVSKSAKDLLTKPYATSHKVEVKTSADGVTLTTEAVLTKPSSVLLKSEFSFGDGFKVEKFSIGTDSKLALEMSNSTLVPSTKLYLKGSDASRASGAGAISATIGAEYTRPNLTAVVEVNALETATLPVDASIVIDYEGFLVGGQVGAGLKSLAVTDANVLLGYKSKKFAAALQTEKYLKTVGVSVSQSVSSDLTIGALAKLPTSASNAGKLDLAAGLSYNVSADQVLHAKVNQAGRVGLSYVQALASARPALPTKLTLSCDLDAANVASDEHKFGFTLNISA